VGLNAAQFHISNRALGMFDQSFLMPQKNQLLYFKHHNELVWSFLFHGFTSDIKMIISINTALCHKFGIFYELNTRVFGIPQPFGAPLQSFCYKDGIPGRQHSTIYSARKTRCGISPILSPMNGCYKGGVEGYKFVVNKLVRINFYPHI